MPRLPAVCVGLPGWLWARSARPRLDGGLCLLLREMDSGDLHRLLSTRTQFEHLTTIPLHRARAGSSGMARIAVLCALVASANGKDTPFADLVTNVDSNDCLPPRCVMCRRP